MLNFFIYLFAFVGLIFFFIVVYCAVTDNEIDTPEIKVFYKDLPKGVQCRISQTNRKGRNPNGELQLIAIEIDIKQLEYKPNTDYNYNNTFKQQ